MKSFVKMNRSKPRSEEQERPAGHKEPETQERFAAARLELDALRAMLGLPHESTRSRTGPDDPEATQADAN